MIVFREVMLLCWCSSNLQVSKDQKRKKKKKSEKIFELECLEWIAKLHLHLKYTTFSHPCIFFWITLAKLTLATKMFVLFSSHNAMKKNV